MKTSVFLKRDRDLRRGNEAKGRVPDAGRAQQEAEVILTSSVQS